MGKASIAFGQRDRLKPTTMPTKKSLGQSAIQAKKRPNIVRQDVGSSSLWGAIKRLFS